MRKKTQQVMVRNVAIGGNAPVVIQSMTNTDIFDTSKTIDQINQLVESGCEIVRLAIPTINAVKAFGNVRKQTETPLVADIHFNHKIALGAIDAGADKIRINPGNIGTPNKLEQVVKKTTSYGIPIRVGVNSGSIEKDILLQEHGPTVTVLVKSANKNIDLCRNFGAENIVLSLKSSNVLDTIAAYEQIAGQTDVPLHIGLTEAGTVKSGTIKSAVALGILLNQGIGDTIRVSLTGDPIHEIYVAKQILASLQLRKNGVDIISCPTCGRTRVDLTEIANDIEKSLEHIKKNVKVALMGCEVNGPGEARDADIGIAFGKNSGVLFKHGKVVKKLSLDDIKETIIKEVNLL